jgi:hypothetical protein
MRSDERAGTAPLSYQFPVYHRYYEMFSPCPCCKTQTVKTWWKSPDDWLGNQILVECAICGSLGEPPDSGLRLHASIVEKPRAAKSATLRVVGQSVNPHAQEDLGILAGDIRNRGRGILIHRMRSVWGFGVAPKKKSVSEIQLRHLYG